MDVTISLPEDLVRLLENEVASGRFQTQSEVIDAALRDYAEATSDHPERLAWLRQAWEDGINSGDAGEIDLEEVKAEARARRAARG